MGDDHTLVVSKTSADVWLQLSRDLGALISPPALGGGVRAR